MKFVYVKNYLKTSRENKIQFLKFLNEFENIKMTNQKILLSDNSILFEFTKETDTDYVKLVIDKFFKKVPDIQAIVVDSILQEQQELTLVLEQNKALKVSL